MKIFRIWHSYFCYYSYGSFVIVASTEEGVRLLARANSADEGEEVWNTATIEEIGEYTGEEQNPFIVLSDFRAG